MPLNAVFVLQPPYVFEVSTALSNTNYISKLYNYLLSFSFSGQNSFHDLPNIILFYTKLKAFVRSGFTWKVFELAPTGYLNSESRLLLHPLIYYIMLHHPFNTTILALPLLLPFIFFTSYGFSILI